MLGGNLSQIFMNKSHHDFPKPDKKVNFFFTISVFVFKTIIFLSLKFKSLVF